MPKNTVLDERVTETFATQYLLSDGTTSNWVNASDIHPRDLEPNSRRALFGNAFRHAGTDLWYYTNNDGVLTRIW